MRIVTVLQILGVSLVVGLLMTAFELTPGQVYEGIADALVAVWGWMVELIGGRWGASLLAGATVVVPVWLIVFVVRRRLRAR